MKKGYPTKKHLQSRVFEACRSSVCARVSVLITACAIGMFAAQAQSQAVEGTWNVNNGNWSAPGSWTGAIIPGFNNGPTLGIDDIANLRRNFSANSTITIDAGVPGTNVVLGSLIAGDTTGNQSLTINGGTITFDTSGANAVLTMENGGNNVTINSNIVINDTLDITVNDGSNNQGIVLGSGGVKSGGVNGTTTMTINDGS